MRRKKRKKVNLSSGIAYGIASTILTDPFKAFKMRMRNAVANETFYPEFRRVMKRRARLHVHRLRMIETKKANRKNLEDADFMLFTNQNDLDEVLAKIGKFYLTEIL